MRRIFKLNIVFLILVSANLAFGQFHIPRIFGKKKSGTQWYGEPRSVAKFKQPYKPRSTVGFGFGSSNYYGELTTYKYPVNSILKMTRWNISANYTKNLSPKFSARIGLTYARIIGDDNNFKDAIPVILTKYSRGLHFRNDLKEFSLVGLLDLTSPRSGGLEYRQKIRPYLFGGIALTSHNPKGRDTTTLGGSVSKPWLSLRSFDTEGQSDLGQKQYSTILLAVPFGGGLKIKLKGRFDLSIEAGLRATFGSGGNYLDDVSGNYYTGSNADTRRFSNRSLEPFSARTGEQRDNTKITIVDLTKPRGNGRQDWYFLTCFQLNYYLDQDIKCPVVR